jgi:hypothetical protein
MAEAIARIKKLIAETETWREFHKMRGGQIEALGAQIRIKALKEALAAVEGQE